MNLLVKEAALPPTVKSVLLLTSDNCLELYLNISLSEAEKELCIKKANQNRQIFLYKDDLI